MNYGCFGKRGVRLRLFSAMLALAIVCSSVELSGSHAAALGDEWDDVFDTARAVLAKMPDTARLEAATTDAGLRDAVLRTYRALKACAKVNKDQGRAVKEGALAEFERAFKAVQTAADKSDYKACAGDCRSDGAKCEERCGSSRKKLCACKLTEFGCFVMICAAV